jgi:hypothetical protein
MESLLTAAHETATASASQVRAIEAQERVMREQAQTMAASLELTKQTAQAAQASADAATDQARIMIARESPVFSFAGFEMEQMSGLSISGINAGIDYYPAVIVKNVGRSYMELRVFSINTIFGEGFPVQAQFPAVPDYKNIVEPGLIIEAQKEARFRASDIVKFTEDEARDLQEGQRIFLIYGFMRYFNQFTNEVSDVGFMRMWSRYGFFTLGLPNYNYHRRHKVDGGDVPLPWRSVRAAT